MVQMLENKFSDTKVEFNLITRVENLTFFPFKTDRSDNDFLWLLCDKLLVCV